MKAISSYEQLGDLGRHVEDYYNSLPDCYTVQEIESVLENLKVPDVPKDLLDALKKSPRLIYLSAWTRCKFDIEQALTNLRKDTNNESH